MNVAILGNGFGPSNRALAIALKEDTWDVAQLFLQRAKEL